MEDLTREAVQEYHEKIALLSPDTERRWGKMDVVRMIRHLRQTIAISLGEVEDVEDVSKPIIRNLIWLVFFNWFTNWPKGKMKAPDYWTPAAEGEFEEERAALLADIERFLERLESDPTEENVTPLIGPLPLTKWAHFHGVHFNHHLKQFGAI